MNLWTRFTFSSRGFDEEWKRAPYVQPSCARETALKTDGRVSSDAKSTHINRRTHSVIAVHLNAVSLQGNYFGSCRQHDHTCCRYCTSQRQGQRLRSEMGINKPMDKWWKGPATVCFPRAAGWDKGLRLVDGWRRSHWAHHSYILPWSRCRQHLQRSENEITNKRLWACPTKASLNKKLR